MYSFYLIAQILDYNIYFYLVNYEPKDNFIYTLICIQIESWTTSSDR